MITPSGTIGPKLGRLIDLYSFTPDTIKIDAFTYIADSGIGQWTNVDIQPNPVGPLGGLNVLRRSGARSWQALHDRV